MLPAYLQGKGNLDHNPLFISSVDLRLQANSPAIDMGSLDGSILNMLPSRDLQNGKRFVSRIDIGALEFQTFNCVNNKNLTGLILGSHVANQSISIGNAVIPTGFHMEASSQTVTLGPNTVIQAGAVFSIDNRICTEIN